MMHHFSYINYQSTSFLVGIQVTMLLDAGLEINSFTILIWKSIEITHATNLKFFNWPSCITQPVPNGYQEGKVIFNLNLHLAFLA